MLDLKKIPQLLELENVFVVQAGEHAHGGVGGGGARGGELITFLFFFFFPRTFYMITGPGSRSPPRGGECREGVSIHTRQVIEKQSPTT